MNLDSYFDRMYIQDNGKLNNVSIIYQKYWLKTIHGYNVFKFDINDISENTTYRICFNLCENQSRLMGIIKSIQLFILVDNERMIPLINTKTSFMMKTPLLTKKRRFYNETIIDDSSSPEVKRKLIFK